MPLQPPNLDDRSFEQLVAEARGRVATVCPTWTDLSPSDPGMVLLELFAHLTETMIYRLNRVPEKAFIEFLRLIGVRVYPPAAASARLRFRREAGAEQALEIPRGTRVTTGRGEGGGEPPVFVTARTASLAAGEAEVEVLAHHCDLVEAELAGLGTGLAGLTLEVARPPIVARTGDDLDLIVGVEAGEEELEEGVPALQHEGRVYRVWREVDNFSNLGHDQHVYVADRMMGTLTFAPAARMRGGEGALEEVARPLAAAPGPGKEIRLWYRRGGGPEGNVAADCLTVLKDPIPGLEVTNPARATGGQAAESLENALARGPQELHSLHRAVTARDFELLAMSSSRAVARARALTRAALWVHAVPGTVECLLVPQLTAEEREAGHVSSTALQARETEPARLQVQQALDERRPLGTTCLVNWARYKTVAVKARIVVRPEANQAAIRQRVLQRLHDSINPLPIGLDSAGWPFGQALRVSHVYDISLAEPGVLWVDQVRLLVEEVPDRSVSSVVADAFQPQTWYAGAGATLFRSLDDGDGWEPAGHFGEPGVEGAGAQIEVVRPHPDRAGLLAVVINLPENGGSRLYLSADCGESWLPRAHTTAFVVRDAAWMLRGDEAVLLLATDAGLYELGMRPTSSPVQVLVDRADQDMGFYAVAASRDIRGQVSVAVAARATRGAFLSSEAGRTDTFRPIGLEGQDLRVLSVQYDGPRSFLWAGAAAAGGDPGQGCFRWELRGAEDPPEGWQPLGADWRGGSCRAIGFRGNIVVAASHRAGVQRLDSSQREPVWEMPDVRCGLPLRDPGRFHPVDTVAVDPAGRLVMAGGAEGVLRSDDGGLNYRSASSKEFLEKVTLPPTWLFCSGEHDVLVVSEDETDRD